MRHGMVNRKLGRTSAHRKAMFRNQLASLIDKERIITTLPKAKELRPLIEKLVTLGKTDSVHSRRQAARVVPEDSIVQKLFGTIGPRFADRQGGYTRIVKLGARRGDATEMAILEFVGYELATEGAEPAPKAEPKKKAPAKKKADAAEAAEPKKKAPKKAAKADGEAKPKSSTKKPAKAAKKSDKA
jgi:large subunit ribosomal protein L17